MIAYNTLAFDGGATRTRAGLYDTTGACLGEANGPPCNPIAYGEERCLHVLADVAAELAGEPPLAVCAGLSGANSVALREGIAAALARRVGVARVVVTDDVWPLLAANAGKAAAILVIAGTGAVVLGQDGRGGWARAGGRGPLLGDDGGGYALAVAALHAAARAVDGVAVPSSLPVALVSAAGAEDFETMPAWCARAGKDALAALANTVIAQADQGDALARNTMLEQAALLARQVDAVARRLQLPKTAPILLHGGVFEGSVSYCQDFTSALAKLRQGHVVRPVDCRGHAAVFRFAAMAEEAPSEMRALLSGL